MSKEMAAMVVQLSPYVTPLDIQEFTATYWEIESFSRFRNSEITVVLTMSVDGVRFKKLSRSEAWPIYIRLEGLPSKEKNKYENIMLAGILFARNTPTERLFSELFSRLKHELTALEAGIPIQLVTPASTSTWICTPKLTHGIIDFGVRCCLDGMGLGAKELDMDVEDLIRSPTNLWERLGKSDGTRRTEFENLKKQRATLGPLCRAALARAMADIRQYIEKDGDLAPKPVACQQYAAKRLPPPSGPEGNRLDYGRSGRVGMGRADKSSCGRFAVTCKGQRAEGPATTAGFCSHVPHDEISAQFMPQSSP
ncbi:hypothetical protein Q1695_005998 [Nippostrongylus brasiliensis]|nr:hypothetical protein Q1695_005998 [Nippostrongylus brasiliensis]